MPEKNGDKFLQTRVSFGLILRTDLETVEKIKRQIADFPNVVIVYQTTEAGHLWIVRKSETEAVNNG
jgi:nitrate reductase NapAB chaperone NapD